MGTLRISDRLQIEHVIGAGAHNGWYHVYFDKYYFGRILGHDDGWLVSFSNYGDLGKFPTIDEAKHVVFEWFATNNPS
jgi:hypothetical protein